MQIGNAFASRPLRDEELCSEVRGVLGTPKPSFYPLYLKQDERPYKTYSTEGATISGTKRYRIHKGASVTTLPQGNIKTMSQINPVPAGQTFKMRIVVHNMRKWKSVPCFLQSPSTILRELIIILAVPKDLATVRWNVQTCRCMALLFGRGISKGV